jgi:DNA-binding ferritin-like protein (Dps family)
MALCAMQYNEIKIYLFDSSQTKRPQNQQILKKIILIFIDKHSRLSSLNKIEHVKQHV